MEAIVELYRELDPLRPLPAEDDALYVDWQKRLGAGGGDVRARLSRGFLRNASPQHWITRLLTGHRGSGKTTELNRVRKQLEEGSDGKRVFVSMLFAQDWLDLEDVQPEDLVLQIVRQLVADLRAAGLELGEQQFRRFFGTLVDRAKGLRLESAELGLDPLKFSFALKDFPTARREFRELLRGQLPTVFDLVNRELLPAAREQLKSRGFDDLVLIVDDLDKIPQKILADHGLTNHENLFLDNAGQIRAINASVLLTIPIELAYSPAQGRLRDDYGGSIATVPLVSIRDFAGNRIEEGEQALIEIVGRRAAKAFGEEVAEAAQSAARIFADHELLVQVIQLCGGHVRGLLVMLTELLDWVDELPIGHETVERYVPRAAKDLARGLLPSDQQILDHVRETGQAFESTRFFDLLRNQYIYAYEAGTDEEYWYGLNPLLAGLSR